MVPEEEPVPARPIGRPGQFDEAARLGQAPEGRDEQAELQCHRHPNLGQAALAFGLISHFPLAVLRWPGPSGPAGSAFSGRGAYELVEHRLESAQADRQVALALFEVSGDARDPGRQPLAVREGDHEVVRTLPQGSRGGHLSQVEAPGLGKSEVVVEPPVHSHPEAVVERGGYVLAELAREHSPVDIGQQRF